MINREFAQGDLGSKKTGYFLLTQKSWTPRWAMKPGRKCKIGLFRPEEIR